MQVVFLSHYALPHLGGIESVVDGLASELADRGHEVVHVASDAGFSRPSEAASGNYRVVRVPALNTLESRVDVPYPLFGRRLLQVLRRELRHADVVHAHGFLYQTSLAAMLLARHVDGSPGTARVLTEHVGHVPYPSKLLDGLESFAIATLGRLALKRADAIIVYNERVGVELRRLAPDRRIDFIGNGVDTSRFSPADEAQRAALRHGNGWSDGVPRVLFVGRPVAKKGIDLVLSVADLTRDEFELVLVGPGSQSKDPGRNVRILGPQPRERLTELYRASDAMLLPSRGEGFPASVQEAMASGLPVVMCSDPSYARHLEGAGAGARLAEPEADALTAALRSVLESPETWRAASSAARRHAVRAFSWSRVADEHEELYARIRGKQLGR